MKDKRTRAMCRQSKQQEIKGLRWWHTDDSYQMPLETLQAFEVLETEFTEVEDGQRGEFLWVWWKVPGLQSVTSQLYALYIFHPGDDVIVAAVGHQAARHAGCRWDAVRTVLWILVVNNVDTGHIRHSWCSYLIKWSVCILRFWDM